MSIKDQKFGLEIELTGIKREKAAKIIAKHFGTEAVYFGGGYYEYHIRDTQDRKWKVVYDSSIRAVNSAGNEASSEYKVEIVSPICVYDDIKDIQEITRKLKEAKGRVNSSCGIHIHINGAPYTAQTLRNLTNIMASKEDMIYKTLQVDVLRENRYCEKVNKDFLEELHRKKPKNINQIQDIWYRGRDGSHIHYHDSRYHGVNLHSLFSKGTVEFRLFNSTLHAGKIRAYLTLCLAISNQALTQKCASRQTTTSTNEKYTFRCWLLRLGLIGEEYKNVRMHLLENLAGCIAWKNPEDAVRQREEIKARRVQEREQTIEPTYSDEVEAVFTAEEPQEEPEFEHDLEPVLSM